MIFENVVPQCDDNHDKHDNHGDSAKAHDGGDDAGFDNDDHDDGIGDDQNDSHHHRRYCQQLQPIIKGIRKSAPSLVLLFVE